MNGIFNKIANFTKEYSPEILIGSGVASMIASTILAVKATPKAIRNIEQEKSDRGVTMLKTQDTIKVAWKPYIPSIVSGVVGAGCIIAGTTQNKHQKAALAAVYSLSENTLRRYKDEVRKMVGDEKADEIDRQVVKSRIKERPVIIDTEDSMFVEQTGNGNTLCFDSLSGRYFRSSINAIDRAVNNVNKSLMSEHYVTVNELYNEIGLSTIGAGSLIGWKAEKDMCEIHYDTEMDDTGAPFVVLYYRNRPEPLYSTAY